MTFEHDLRLTHRRRPYYQRLGDYPAADSEVEITAGSQDLVEAWREMLSRMPNDVYAAVKAAVEGSDR